MIPNDVERDFFAGVRTESVRFVINDPVEIGRGEHEGCRGSVISVLSVAPEVEYLVELGGSVAGDVTVRQDDLVSLE